MHSGTHMQSKYSGDGNRMTRYSFLVAQNLRLAWILKTLSKITRNVAGEMAQSFRIHTALTVDSFGSRHPHQAIHNLQIT